MTARQRPAPGSAAVVPAAVPANGATNGEAAAFRWEQWFAGATPAQRAEALALAREQGLLYVHQLPPVPHHNVDLPQASMVGLCGRLLAGKVDALAPVAHEALTLVDTHLDSLQREAVRRALGVPDVFLLQGLPGTGKSRVATEVIVQAARRGLRCLLLAPSVAAVDVILERLLGCPDVLPVRLLGPGEQPRSLPAALQSLTLAEQRRTFRERALTGARQARAQAEELCARRLREEAGWPKLLQLADQHAALTVQHQSIHAQVTAVEAEVERDAAAWLAQPDAAAATPLTIALAEAQRRTSAARSEWQVAADALAVKLVDAQKQLAEVQAQVHALEPRCQAREHGKWWSVGYWTGAAALTERAGLRARQTGLESALRELTQAQAGQQAALQQIDAKAQAERQEALRTEIERRQQALLTQEGQLHTQLAEVERQWTARCSALEPAEVRPTACDAPAIEAARERWTQQRQRDDVNCQFARQWADYLDEAGEQLGPRLPALANLLAGPIAALGHGRDSADVASSRFDLLIIEDAEHLTEADLLRLAGHAPRLMLVSQTLHDGVAAPVAAKPVRSHGVPSTVMSWPRLWQALGEDLGRLPYAWTREGERLVCQLAAVRADDQRQLEREGLADAPEIELHILNLPRAKPVLARVSFPGHYTIPEATRFIHRELDELPIQPLGRTAWWDETPEAWVLHLGPACSAPAEVVALESGIRLHLLDTGSPYTGRTARVEFARSAWPDRAATLPWLEGKLLWRSRERAVFLQVPHRMYRPLAEIVGPLLFPDACLAALLTSRAAADVHFEFVPVPLPRRSEWPREGAGLEQDLATGRHGDRLPVELRAELPRKGYVNFLEAQALIRRLERWAQSPAELASNGKKAPVVLVLSLHEAQVELLRQLTARSPILQARQFPLEIAVPAEVHQRECDILVLSLTRSHPHRSVPLGEQSIDLALALTRPRQRMLVFGDPGMLSKRTQWQGPLDHLDAAEAQVEAGRVTRLLRHAQSAVGAGAAATVTHR